MAYAALLSLTHILDHTLHQDYQLLIRDEKQQIIFLLKRVSYLQDVLDNSSQKSSKAIESLESRITNAAHKAEDIVESNIRRRVLEESRSHKENNCSRLSIPKKPLWSKFKAELEKVIEEIDTIKKRVEKIEDESNVHDLDPMTWSSVASPKPASSNGTEEIDTIKKRVEKIEDESDVQDLDPMAWSSVASSKPASRNGTEEIDTIKKRVENIEDESDVQDLDPMTWSSVASSKPASSGKINMVGLDDNMMVIKDQLTGESSNLETISIVGMGGIGKTTMANKVYNDEFIVYHFYIRAWVTVSQNYIVREILLGLLDSMKKLNNQIRAKTTQKLKEILYKNIKNRRYLVVMDDMWDTTVWDQVKGLFPNDKNGSRIMITTRLENVAGSANSCYPPHQMRFLNKKESWSLFCENVFGKDRCPCEFKYIGKKIVKSCQGLPLPIVVIAGHLAKATRTQDYWTNVGEKLSSVIASYDEQCSRILSLSYKNLPHHLKGCFLYMGIFPAECNIRVFELVKLWVAEGLIKSVESKYSEDVAEEYLLDLVDRNIVLVCQRDSRGKIKTCMIHDLLRDLCVREAQKENFFHVNESHLHGISEGIILRRLCIHTGTEVDDPTSKNLPNQLLRSLLNFSRHSSEIKLLNGMLLRVLFGVDIIYRPTEMDEVVNLRYLACRYEDKWLPASVYKLRNLQTFIIYGREKLIYLEPEIWKMTQLRHVQSGRMILSEPPSEEIEAENCVIVLENLQTLSIVMDFRCTEDIVKRIPNLKKLGIRYGGLLLMDLDLEYFSLNNLVHLHQLESLKCLFLTPSPSFLHNIIFPPSLKKLTLGGIFIAWEDMRFIGSLLNLEVLKLKSFAFSGPEWEPNEGEFIQLKYLLLEDIDLVQWRADSIHFPSLQRLVLKQCYKMEEIPSGVGEIPNLQMIEVHCCNSSLVTSAKQIEEEQRSVGNDSLQVLLGRKWKQKIKTDFFNLINKIV